jgi:predicted ATPase
VQAAVIEALASAQALLVVDNCEHVVDEASRILTVLAQYCPHLAILATSRVALDVALGQTRTVEPLPVPPAGGDGDDEGSPAVQLFLDRARAVRPDLELGPAERERVAEVCRRLDGLPLAIELAAARLRSLNVADVAERLDDRFRLLSAKPRATLARHQTLRAVVDWSFELLSETEQRLFERLSVFAGAFTPAAAERVCAGSPVEVDEIVDLLTGIVDASMVIVGPSQGEVTYRLLETMRTYGRARLAESDELEWFERAHARHYVDVAETADRGVRGPDEATWVARLDRDFPNLRQAQSWTVRHTEPDLALRLAAGLFRYALLRLRDEALRWADSSMQLPGARTHPRWPIVCAAAGWGCGLRGQRDRAWELAAHGLARVEPGDPGHVPLLEVKAHIELWEGRLDDCIATMDHAADLTTDPYELFPWTVRSLALAYADRTDEAIAMAQRAQSDADRLGNPTMMALSRYSLGEALLERDPDAAAAVFDRAIELAEAVHNRIVLGVAGVSVMSLRARHGEPAEALRSSASVLELWAQTNDWTHFGVGLRSVAELFARVDADEAAAVLLGAVLDGEVGPPVYGADAERLAGLADRLEQKVGTSALAAARGRGQAMTAAEALDFAQAEVERIHTVATQTA